MQWISPSVKPPRATAIAACSSSQDLPIFGLPASTVRPSTRMPGTTYLRGVEGHGSEVLCACHHNGFFRIRSRVHFDLAVDALDLLPQPTDVLGGDAVGVLLKQ